MKTTVWVKKEKWFLSLKDVGRKRARVFIIDIYVSGNGVRWEKLRFESCVA
jgi:hypothetical protein